MPKIQPRRYLIEIRDAKGSVWSAAAYWRDKDMRVALTQITRVAGLPEVNFCPEPLEPESAKGKARRRTARVNR
jgi:hypothetical protein